MSMSVAQAHTGSCRRWVSRLRDHRDPLSTGPGLGYSALGCSEYGTYWESIFV